MRPGDYVIGCHAEAEINIDAEGVAERHAQLTVNYHELFIEDLGSDSGTFVGGKRVTESTRLWPSQKVQIGSVVLETRKVKSVADSDRLARAGRGHGAARVAGGVFARAQIRDRRADRAGRHGRDPRCARGDDAAHRGDEGDALAHGGERRAALHRGGADHQPARASEHRPGARARRR